MRNWRDALQSKAMRNVVIGIFVTDAIGVGVLQAKARQAEWDALNLVDAPVLAMQTDRDLAPPPTPARTVAAPASFTPSETSALAVAAVAKAPSAVEPVKLAAIAAAEPGEVYGAAERRTAPRQGASPTAASQIAGSSAVHKRPTPAAEFAMAFTNARAGAGAGRSAGRGLLSAAEFAAAFAAIRAGDATPAPDGRASTGYPGQTPSSAMAPSDPILDLAVQSPSPPSPRIEPAVVL
jgi:hypothetical protein